MKNDCIDKLIRWAKENNLPQLEAIDGRFGAEYIGFPQKEKEITFLADCDCFGKESFYDTTNLFLINLNRYNINELPKELFQLKGIHRLYLHDNNLTELSNDIDKLEYLYVLDLGKNHIKHLPESFCNLEYLESLNLYGNDLKELPKDIIYLDNLYRINIAGNPNLTLTKTQAGWLQSLDEFYLNIDDDLYSRNTRTYKDNEIPF